MKSNNQIIRRDTESEREERERRQMKRFLGKNEYTIVSMKKREK